MLTEVYPFDDESFHQLSLSVKSQNVNVQDSPPLVDEGFLGRPFVPHRYLEFLPICGLEKRINREIIVTLEQG